MCGRFSLHTSSEELAAHFGLDEVPDLKPRYNIAPTQSVAVVRDLGAGRRLDQLVWGFESTGAGPPLINARSETAAERPTFREAWRHRRCLVPADGFFEWRTLPEGRRPLYFRLTDGGVLALAGLWQSEPASDGGRVERCTILTTTPNRLVAPIHDRMPVMLAPDDYDRWLTGSPAEWSSPLPPWPADGMTVHPVAPAVNRWDHDTPDCIAPYRYETQADLFG